MSLVYDVGDNRDLKQFRTDNIATVLIIETDGSVLLASISTRGTGMGSSTPNLITVFEEQGEWPSASKANQFLHLNPGIFHQNQQILTDVYSESLN